MGKSFPSELSFCYKTAAPDSISLVHDYWSFSSSEMSAEWAVPVREIAAKNSIKSGQVAKAAREYAIAYDLSTRCSECNEPRAIESRSDFSSPVLGTFRCETCQIKAYEAAQNERRMIEDAAQTKKRQVLEALISKDCSIDYSRLEPPDVVLVFAMMLASDRVCGPGILDDAITPLFPSPRMRRDALMQLYNSKLLAVAPHTPVGAIRVDDAGAYSFDALNIAWHLAQDTCGRTFPEVFSLLAQMIDERENDHRWQKSISDLWWQIGLEDTEQFLHREVHNYRFREFRLGEKTQLALQHSLKTFSIPQVRRLLRRVIEKAAALSQNRNYSTPHALNTIPGSLISVVDRAISDQWTIYPLISDWDDEPLLLRILFNRILRTGLDGFRTANGLSIANCLTRVSVPNLRA